MVGRFWLEQSEQTCQVRCHLLGRCFRCKHRWYYGHACKAEPAELPPQDAPAKPRPKPKPAPKKLLKKSKQRPGPKPREGPPKSQKRVRTKAQMAKRARACKKVRKTAGKLHTRELKRCRKAMAALRKKRKRNA